MNASHDDFYPRIFVKIFSEGRRQDFSCDHKVFPNWPKNLQILQMTTSIRGIMYMFSRKDVGRKNVHILPKFIGVKWFNFTWKDISRMSQSLIGMIPPGGAWGGGSLPIVSTSFLPGWWPLPWSWQPITALWFLSFFLSIYFKGKITILCTLMSETTDLSRTLQVYVAFSEDMQFSKETYKSMHI